VPLSIPVATFIPFADGTQRAPTRLEFFEQAPRILGEQPTPCREKTAPATHRLKSVTYKTEPIRQRLDGASGACSPHRERSLGARGLPLPPSERFLCAALSSACHNALDEGAQHDGRKVLGKDGVYWRFLGEVRHSPDNLFFAGTAPRLLLYAPR
jgi:hypothetical protein